ncbi:MAG: transglycosylase SLT domain-containing protein [Acidobacteria bacterium]|nr:transglycosylase SLT domain-containing protein [Acidobacteriota bacterium]
MATINLTIRSPEHTQKFEMKTNHLTIGRGNQANLIIQDPSLSKIHASIHQENNHIWILNECSNSESFVNNIKVPTQGLPINDGDKIRLGKATVIDISIKSFLTATQKKTNIPITKLPQNISLVKVIFIMISCLFVITSLVWFLTKKPSKATSINTVNVEETRNSNLPISTNQSPQIEESAKENNLVENNLPKEEFIKKDIKLYLKMTEEEKLDFVDKQAQHISLMMGNRPYAFTDDVLGYIRKYVDSYAQRTNTTSTKLWGENLHSLYARASLYAPEIIRSFNLRGVAPVVGIYIVMIETEYHECLESPVGAKGLFQFMPATARAYGVDPNDRCNVKKMSPAAASYMADRITEFGPDAMSVALAIAGYNRSPDSVRRDLHDVINSENRERSFWTLVANSTKLDRPFQNENIKYVPKFFAAAIIGENPWAFGLKLRPLSTYNENLSPEKLSNSSYSQTIDQQFEKTVVELIRRISSDDKPYVFPETALQEIKIRVESYRNQPSIANALFSLNQHTEKLALLARQEGVEPALFFYILLAELISNKEIYELNTMSKKILEELITLRATFGTTLADSSLIILAAYRMGSGTKKSHPLLAAMRKIVKNPQTERNIWFLREHGEINDEVYDFVINCLALGLIGQNPKAYGINAPAFSY